MNDEGRNAVIVSIFAVTCVSMVAIYLWASRAILHRGEAALDTLLRAEQETETIGE